MTQFREITSGLRFPEGPIAMPDGSVILVEIERQTLTRVLPDGSQEIIAKTGGGPNGAAMGPDGKCYICNNGGFNWGTDDGILHTIGASDDYVTGSIQRVDLETGRCRRAADLLGHWWEIEGRVQDGEKRGRQLGFPTANLTVGGTLHPDHGVYALWAGLKDAASDSWQWHPAVANLGRRPTFDENELLLEVHVLDFDGDLYGQRLRACFVERVRPERRFDGLEALKAQIASDTASAREILAAGSSPDIVSSATNF